MSGATFHALVDHDDRLLSGDARFAALNADAGGRVGTGIAIAPVATLVRLARRLEVPIARRVTIADGDSDGEWHVRVVPGDDRTIALAATLLRRQAPAAAVPAMPADVPVPADALWGWEVDAALRLTRIAPHAAEFLGNDTVAALASPLSSLFVLEAAPDGGMPLIEAMAAAADFGGQTATVRGNGRRVSLSGNVRRDGAGGFAGFVGGVFDEEPVPGRDVSGGFNERLHRVLHEPLGHIIAQAEAIGARGEGAVDGRYADYAADIAAAGRHLMSLVDDLADLEAIERPGFVTARERVDLADVARRATGLLAGEAADAGVFIDPVVGDADAVALAEYRRTLQILVNLMGNAVRHSPAGSTVRLYARRRHGNAVLIVADDGPGISEDDQRRIFEKFVRGSDTEARGNGLGLYIAQRLAQAMNGTLTVDSRLGEGARFTLTLPAAR